MKPYHYKSDEVELGAYVDEHDMIHLRMSGNLSEDNIEPFEAWGEAVREAMRTVAARTPEVLTLIDVRGACEADKHSMASLHELMRHNKQYATRTAVFGASYFIQLIIDMALHITKRTNMRVFETRDEALGWLRHTGTLAHQ